MGGGWDTYIIQVYSIVQVVLWEEGGEAGGRRYVQSVLGHTISAMVKMADLSPL